MSTANKDTIKWLVSTILQSIVVAALAWGGIRLYVDKTKDTIQAAIDGQQKYFELSIINQREALVALKDYFDVSLLAHENKTFHAGAQNQLQEINTSLQQLKAELNTVNQRLYALERKP